MPLSQLSLPFPFSNYFWLCLLAVEPCLIFNVALLFWWHHHPKNVIVTMFLSDDKANVILQEAGRQQGNATIDNNQETLPPTPINVQEENILWSTKEYFLMVDNYSNQLRSNWDGSIQFHAVPVVDHQVYHHTLFQTELLDICHYFSANTVYKSLYFLYQKHPTGGNIDPVHLQILFNNWKLIWKRLYWIVVPP